MGILPWCGCDNYIHYCFLLITLKREEDSLADAVRVEVAERISDVIEETAL